MKGNFDDILGKNPHSSGIEVNALGQNGQVVEKKWLDWFKKSSKKIVLASGGLFIVSGIVTLYNMLYNTHVANSIAILFFVMNAVVIAVTAIILLKSFHRVDTFVSGVLTKIYDDNERHMNYLDAANDVIFELEVDSGKVFFSNKWSEISTYPPIDKITWVWLKECVYAEDLPVLHHIVTQRKPDFYESFRIHTSSGQERWLAIKGRWLLAADGKTDRISGSLTNVTQQKKSEAYLEFIAYHDSLTMLPNRSNFMDILDATIAESIEKNIHGAMFFIDIDNFKVINDMYGHTFGDRLLVEVSERLRMLSEVEDIVARFGGDEFMILIKAAPNKESVEDRAKNIISSFNEPVILDNQSFYMTSSVGVAMFPDDGDNVTEIVKNSDAAMYESKKNGKNTYAFYHKDISQKIFRKNQILDILRTSIEDGKVHMEYQPQFDLETNRVEGFEALMRLNDPLLGFISPAEFIPIAEESGSIISLGFWALRQAIDCDKILCAQGIDHKWIAVNVSEVQLQERDFLTVLQSILDEKQYDPTRLHLEITEGILLSDIDEKSYLFNEMVDMGIKIELDDFGTGYSSLNYIRTIPLHTIKIDKCFIDEIGISPEKESLIELIINLAKEYGMSTICEGVETAEQVDFLRNKGANYLQGYYYSRSLMPEAIVKKVQYINENF